MAGWVQTCPPNSEGHRISVGGGANVESASFGNVPVTTICGQAWDDVDGDGVIDPGEPTLEGLTIYLDLNRNGRFDADADASVRTGVDGSYWLYAPPGIYAVAAVPPEDWVPTYPPAGAHTVSAPPATIVKGIGFGYARAGQIRGLLWHDLNTNGRRDPLEPTLRSWTVYIDRNHNNRLDEDEPRTLTDDHGGYAFTGLSQGSYLVRQIPGEDWFQTAPEGGSYLIELAISQALEGVDFGDRLPFDVDGNGCVNVSDQLWVRVNLGHRGNDIAPSHTDLNGDGVVNVSDLVLIRLYLGLGCNME
jgi:hypothetical protein